ncbi:MAG: hypothetical protein N3H30_01320 [Candidatus Micrarchaeota archaeon]|nr:hypothetical protein [Candidatus Micrarchaeota archaeon]
MPKLVLVGERHDSPNLKKIGEVIPPFRKRKNSVLLVECRGPKSIFEREGPAKDDFFMGYRKIISNIDRNIGGSVVRYLSKRGIPPTKVAGLEPVFSFDFTYFVASQIGAKFEPSLDAYISLWKYYKTANMNKPSSGLSELMRSLYLYYHPLLAIRLMNMPVEKRFIIGMYSNREVEFVPNTEMPVAATHDYLAMKLLRSELHARSILHFLNEGKDVYAICGLGHIPVLLSFVRGSAAPQVELFFTEPAMDVFSDPMFEGLRSITMNFMS